MKEANIERALAKTIRNYTERKEDINRAVCLREELGLSSFDLIALSTEIEDLFSITIDNVDILAEIDTFGDLVDIIAERIPTPQTAYQKSQYGWLFEEAMTN